MTASRYGFDAAPASSTGAADHGAKPELRWLPVNRLSVDMAYQRSLESDRSKRLIANIAAGFEWALFGVVTVSPLPFETWELMDGQHRVAGAKAAGIIEVPASIIQAPTIEQRARIFRAANSQRVAMHAFALYHASVLHKDPAALAIADLAAKADVEIPRYPMHRANLKPRQTLALGALKRLALEQAPAGAIRTLKILRAAFPEEPGALQSHLILGLREWVRAHPACDELGVAGALQRYGLERLEKRIFSIGLGGNRRAEAAGNVLAQVVPPALGGRTPAVQPTESARQAAFAPRNRDLLECAKQFDAPGSNMARPFDPGAMQRKPAPAAVASRPSPAAVKGRDKSRS